MSSDTLTTRGAMGNVPLADNDTPGPLLRRQFEVVSVEKVDTPGGAQGGDWHRYVMASGPAQIMGYHRGTPEEVADYAASCAENFNLRNATGKSSRLLAGKKAK